MNAPENWRRRSPIQRDRCRVKRLRDRTITALVVAVTCALLAGCGSGGSSARAIQTPPFAILSAQQVDAAKAGTPDRTVLSWWRYMQYRSASNALLLFTPSLQAVLMQDTSYQNAVYSLFGPWLAHVQPTITSVSQSHNRATVYVRGRVAQASGRTVAQSGDVYIGIALTHGSGGWQISDDSFFNGQVAVLEQASATAAKQSGSSG